MNCDVTVLSYMKFKEIRKQVCYPDRRIKKSYLKIFLRTTERVNRK